MFTRLAADSKALFEAANVETSMAGLQIALQSPPSCLKC
jgi:hypothetical protein